MAKSKSVFVTYRSDWGEFNMVGIFPTLKAARECGLKYDDYRIDEMLFGVEDDGKQVERGGIHNGIKWSSHNPTFYPCDYMPSFNPNWKAARQQCIELHGDKGEFDADKWEKERPFLIHGN